SYNILFMPNLLQDKSVLILGVANRWSIAYAIGQACRREGARLFLTYQSERQQKTVEELGTELGAEKVIACDVTQDEQVSSLVTELQASAGIVHSVVHSIVFANREDLSRPFVETSR